MYIWLPEKLTSQNMTSNEEVCEDINGLTIDSQPEHIGTAKFVDEAAICSEIPASTANHYTLLDTADVQSVKEYLARPRMIASGPISTGAGFLTTLRINNSSALRNLVNPVQWDRLKGAVGMRCTLKFTLVVAATPFHQGILNLNWQYATDSDVFPLHARGSFLPTSYNLPKVLLDMAETTMVALDVPYVSHLEYFPIDVNSDVLSYYGNISITKLTNPRVVVGQSTPEFSLYISLHDIELIGAVPYTSRFVILQSGSSGKTSGISRTHAEMKRGGLISKALESTANVAKALSYVPSLSAVGGTADWFLRAASKVASSFGYSKPTDENKPMRINRITYAGDSHIDMPFQGFTTTPFVTNKLAVNSALGCTDDDQMAMDYVLTKPSLVFRGQMSETDAVGSTLYGSFVCPNYFWYRDKEFAGGVPTGNLPIPQNATGTVNAFFPSTLLYVANNFRYWRGDIKFKVTFSKSKMHGGRIQFAYFPFVSVPAANQQLGNGILAPEAASGLVQPTGMTTVFDLRDGNSFEFTCPYMCTDPYLPVEGATGCVSMSIVNQLRAPGVAASTIDFLVEVSAVEGFELACFCPATIGGLQPTGAINATYQSGASSELKLFDKVDDASQNIIGERFLSLKQLAMIPAFAGGDIANAAIIRVTMTPWFKLNGVPVTAPFGITGNDTALWLNSPCLRVASLYAFANGATNYQYVRDGGPTINATASAYQFPNTSGTTFTEVAGLWNRNQNSSGGVLMFETSETSRWTVPTFSRYARIPVVQAFSALGGWQRALAPGGDGRVNYNPAFFNNRVDLTLRNGSGSSRRFVIGRSASDDARASQFIGPPPCALYLATATVSPVADGDRAQGVACF